MLTQLIVVDDFLQDPMLVREAALKLDYPKPQKRTNFPGRNSARRLVIPGLDQAVSQIVGEPVEGSPFDAHCKCRITLARDEGTGLAGVHIDPTTHWSGILYLTLPENCQGGTTFFRHKRLGTDQAPLFDHELRAQGFESFDDVHSKLLAHDTNDLSKWEQLMTVPMRFNRLVLLRPWLWHTAGAAFGDRPENGRLVYLLFFRQAHAMR